MEISTLSYILIQEHEKIDSIGQCNLYYNVPGVKSCTAFPVVKIPDLGPTEMDMLATLDC